jgi:hypothetical protein
MNIQSNVKLNTNGVVSNMRLGMWNLNEDYESQPSIRQVVRRPDKNRSELIE